MAAFFFFIIISPSAFLSLAFYFITLIGKTKPPVPVSQRKDFSSERLLLGFRCKKFFDLNDGLRQWLTSKWRATYSRNLGFHGEERALPIVQAPSDRLESNFERLTPFGVTFPAFCRR
jgi:hypothetical protein